jgi:hypothetical protein
LTQFPQKVSLFTCDLQLLSFTKII